MKTSWKNIFYKNVFFSTGKYNMAKSEVLTKFMAMGEKRGVWGRG